MLYFKTLKNSLKSKKFTFRGKIPWLETRHGKISPYGNWVIRYRRILQYGERKILTVPVPISDKYQNRPNYILFHDTIHLKDMFYVMLQ
jgi:hypothetical protein